MHLYFSTGPDGKRQYTLKKVTNDGRTTVSAHPGACLRLLYKGSLVSTLVVSKSSSLEWFLVSKSGSVECLG